MGAPDIKDLDLSVIQTPENVSYPVACFLRMLAEGYRNAEIAEVLGYSSEASVKATLYKVAEKLKIQKMFPNRHTGTVLLRWWLLVGQHLPVSFAVDGQRTTSTQIQRRS